MSDVNDLASSLFGTSRAEVASGGTSALYGTAATDSSGGSVSVRMGADTLRADGQAGTSVLVPTTTDVRAGETVIVTVVDGHPVVTGVVGSGDRLRTDVDAAAGAASSAQESADSAKASADAATKSAKTAQSKADAATESAATAQAKAEDAGKAATQAKSDAASAKTAATAAQTKADEAATAAATAQSKADTASTAAATAQSKAEDATTSANAAGRAAANAQAAAEAAQGDIDSQQTYFWHDSDGSHVLGEKDGYRSDVRADGLHVLSAKDSSELARFTASGSQLGADNRAHQSMDYHSWRLVDADGVEFAHISDLRDESGEYQVEEVGAGINADNAGGGYFQYLSHPLKRMVSVEIHQISTTKKAAIEYTLGQYDGHYYGISDMIDTVTCSAEAIRTALIAAGVEPDSDYAAQIHYTYTTSDPRMKAFTFGGRSTGSEIGGNSMTVGIDSSATGLASVAMGCGSHAGNDFSAAIGGYVTTNTQSQVAVGRGNKVDSKYAFMVGNGTGPGENFGIASWSNAFTVDWSGNGEFQGGMTLGTPLPVASGGTGANSASAAFKNLSGYTLDLGTNNTSDTCVPVMNGSTIQHRVLPTLPFPVSAGGTGATDADGARANLGLDSASIMRQACGINNSGHVTDANSATTPGIYSVYKGANNIPSSAVWGLMVVTKVGDWINQTLINNYTNDGQVAYTRSLTDGKNWGNWQPLASSNEKSVVPIYRLINPYTGVYLYTSSSSEYNSLISSGWSGEGTNFYAFN